MAAVAREQGITIDRIRQIKEKGLRRLRIGKAKRELSLVPENLWFYIIPPYGG